MPGSARQDEVGQLILAELPLRVVRDAENQPASEVRLAQAAFEREDLSDLDVGVLLLPVQLPEGRRGETDRPFLVEVDGRADERLVRPHAFADVVAAAALVPAGRGVELESGSRVGPPAVPAKVERANCQVGEAGVDSLANCEGRRFDRRVGPGQHQQRAVVRAQELGLAHIPEDRSRSWDRDAPGSTLRGADRLAVRVLDGVGVVAKIEERGVEAGLRLRPGLHAEVTKTVTAIQLRVGGHREEQCQPARRAQ